MLFCFCRKLSCFFCWSFVAVLFCCFVGVLSFLLEYVVFYWSFVVVLVAVFCLVAVVLVVPIVVLSIICMILVLVAVVAIAVIIVFVLSWIVPFNELINYSHTIYKSVSVPVSPAGPSLPLVNLHCFATPLDINLHLFTPIDVLLSV